MDESLELQHLRARVCGHKHRHETARRARAHSNHLKHEFGQHKTPYRCPFCRYWHVGSPPSMETVQKIALAIRGML